MKKLYAAFLLSTCLGFSVSAQTLVGTAPTNKNAIIEEFTGVRCPNCPDGHIIAANILASYPNRAFVIGYHPSNSNYTTPVNGSDPDFRRSQLDVYYASTFIGSRFMPGAMINRREWGNPAEKNTSRGSWDGHAQTIMNEVSPCNVGVQTTYNATTETLTVDVEVYFTQDISGTVTKLNCQLMEDGLVAEQYSGSANYVHKHVFRENLASIWGDPIAPTTNGTLITQQYVFDMSNAEDPIDINNATVLVFVHDNNTDEVHTGVAVAASGGQGQTVSIDEEPESVFDLSVYPNPTSDVINLKIETNQAENLNVSIVDLTGKRVFETTLNNSNGTRYMTLTKDELELSNGVYFIQMAGENNTLTKKIVVQ